MPSFLIVCGGANSRAELETNGCVTKSKENVETMPYLRMAMLDTVVPSVRLLHSVVVADVVGGWVTRASGWAFEMVKILKTERGKIKYSLN